MGAINRRHLLTAGLSAGALGFSGLTACGRKSAEIIPDDLDPDAPVIDPKLARQEGTLEWAVSGNWRNSVDKGRDRFRHPIDMLNFFEIKPRDTVLDMWPGAGYMTEIVAPYLAKGKGQYIAALIVPGNPATDALGDKYQAHFSGNKKLYGTPEFTQFGDITKALAEPGSVDLAMMLLVIQDWMARGIAEKAFSDVFAALKPGGILGVEQHRADIGTAQDPGATSGYVQEPFVKQLAAEAGFQYVGASEMNANPKDDKEHPFGVWTLPPQRLTNFRGQPPNPAFDGALYESIGESDRMTLKFRKPQ